MRIITIPQFGIGDTLIPTPTIKILKESLPKSHITVLTMFKTTYQVLLYNPFIDELLYIPFLKMGTFNTLKRLLRFRGRYDVSINFYPSNRYQYNIFAFLIGAPKRLGHHYIEYDIRSLNFLKNYTIKEDPEKHAVEENLTLLKFFDIKYENKEYPLIYIEKDYEAEAAKKYLQDNGLLNSFLVGFHPGSSAFKKHIFKRWPAEKFAVLADLIIAKDRERRILLFGGKEDADAIDAIMKQTKNPEKIFYVEKSSIRDTASVLKNCKVFVSNDSGLMHLAAALKVPTVALFGPTNPKWVRPWGVKYKIVRLGLPCSPCFYYSPKPMDCPANLNYKCIRDLPVEWVYNATEELLRESQG